MAAGSDDQTPDRSARFAAGVIRASAAAVAFRKAWRSNAAPRTAAERMARDHELAAQKHQADLKRHEGQLRKLRRRARNAGGLAIVSGTVAIADFVTAGPELWFWVGAPTAVISGWTARSMSQRAKELQVPKVRAVPPPPPQPLPPGVIGHEESIRLNGARVQMAQLLPTIALAQESAAAEVRSADSEAAPVLGALVARLSALNRVIVDYPGTPAADAARRSSLELRRSVAAGVSMYEELLQAGVELLGTPGSHHVATNRLHTSIHELASYSEGLRRAADTLPPGT